MTMEQGRLRRQAVYSYFQPLIIHFITAQAADLFWVRTLGPDSVNRSAGVSVLTGMICIPIFAIRLREGRVHAGETAPERTAVWMAAAVVSGAALSLLWGACCSFFGLSELFPAGAQERLFSASLILQIAGPGLLAPVCEELLFRGLMFRAWSGSFGRRSGILMVSLTFALYHGNPLQFLYAFPMGLILQFFLEKGGGPACPAACHMAANLTSILVEAFA